MTAETRALLHLGARVHARVRSMHLRRGGRCLAGAVTLRGVDTAKRIIRYQIDRVRDAGARRNTFSRRGLKKTSRRDRVCIFSVDDFDHDP